MLYYNINKSIYNLKVKLLPQQKYSLVVTSVYYRPSSKKRKSEQRT